MTKRFGFTLAEVLITLGIIGVVAAMTMPTLINSTNGAQYKAAFKKALSALSQAVTLNVALDDVNFADTIAGGGTSADTDRTTDGTIANIFNKRMNIVKGANALSDNHDIKDAASTPTSTALFGAAYAADEATTNNGLPTVNTFLFFNDGMMFAFDGTDSACTIAEGTSTSLKVCEGYIDVNGEKGPNRVMNCSTPASTKKDTYAKDATSGKVTKTEADACEVDKVTDVYPVYFYDQTIVPSTNAGKAVLYGK